MRETHCGQCRKELEWEEETPGYHTAQCRCGRRYSLLKIIRDKAQKKLPAWAKTTCSIETHSWEQRARIDADYHGEIQT
jgi:hypothetical protein